MSDMHQLFNAPVTCIKTECEKHASCYYGGGHIKPKKLAAIAGIRAGHLEVFCEDVKLPPPPPPPSPPSISEFNEWAKNAQCLHYAPDNSCSNSEGTIWCGHCVVCRAAGRKRRAD